MSYSKADVPTLAYYRMERSFIMEKPLRFDFRYGSHSEVAVRSRHVCFAFQSRHKTSGNKIA
jgi:hypothetical protein